MDDGRRMFGESFVSADGTMHVVRFIHVFSTLTLISVPNLSAHFEDAKKKAKENRKAAAKIWLKHFAHE